MRFDFNLRSTVKEQFREVAQQMQSWQGQNQLDEAEIARIREHIRCFAHTTSRSQFRIAGVDGSGDFPMLSYEDSFIYLSVAQATIYESDRVSGLKEMAPMPEAILDVSWIPDNSIEGPKAIDRAHEKLAGRSLNEIVQRSDYRILKSKESNTSQSIETLRQGLIRPPGSDRGNLAIQLRTTAEMSAALRLIESDRCPHYLLVDTTHSLPLVSSGSTSLFYEHLKRLCCVMARERGVGFFSLSKSHGLPSMEVLERLTQQVQELESEEVAEHWYLRIPTQELDGWEMSSVQGRRVPPPGAISYLVRFHRSTPVLRLDMDREYWEKFILKESEENTYRSECQMFEDLDYASHDQRVYGYPYPIKAAHDRSSLTEAERVALRKQLIAEAVAQGMSPKLFRDASQATGHR